jgi:MAE_28990/MAE_18760-like HEPN
MTRIKSTYQLQDEIQQDLAKRKKEIQTLHQMLGSTTESHQKLVLHKAAFVLIYSHLEGFFKSTITSYFEYVSSQNLSAKDSSAAILALYLLNEISTTLKDAKKIFLHQKVVEEILGTKSSPLKCNTENWLKSLSNLNSNVIDNILSAASLDLNLKEFKNLKTRMDASFLKARNEIAHGDRKALQNLGVLCGNSDVNDEELINEFSKVVMESITTFADEILRSVEEKKYMKL